MFERQNIISYEEETYENYISERIKYKYANSFS